MSEPLTPDEEAWLREGRMPNRPDYIVPRLLAALDEARSAHSLPVGDDSPSPDEPLRVLGAMAHYANRDHADNDGCIVCIAARPILARLSKEDTDDRP